MDLAAASSAKKEQQEREKAGTLLIGKEKAQSGGVSLFSSMFVVVTHCYKIRGIIQFIDGKMYVSLMGVFNLNDYWGDLNPTTRRYTFFLRIYIDKMNFCGALCARFEVFSGEKN